MLKHLLYATCLKTNYTLRRQLVTSYGFTALLSIVLVVTAALISAFLASNVVTGVSDEFLVEELTDVLRQTAIETAIIVTERFVNIRGSAAMLAEISRDRIVGYPNEFHDDRHIPFVDMETGEKIYPLKAKLLPRDFENPSNWQEENIEQHVQERAEFHRKFNLNFMTTTSSNFFYQGNCDPNETNPKAAGYYPNCTVKNNDASLGGVVQNTKTLAGLEQRAADIALFMKPLLESDPSIMTISLAFHNSGAGAMISMPGHLINSTYFYPSAGCDWMKQINPLSQEPYGTEEDIARCHPAGTMVPLREYNPMERPIYADQALHPGETRIWGPYLNAGFGQWRITVGQGIFDRRTGYFIGCSTFDLNLEMTNDLLQSLAVSDRFRISLVRLDGTVVAGVGFDPQSQATKIANITETDFISAVDFAMLSDFSMFDSIWDPAEVKERLDQNFVHTQDERILFASLSPYPPDEYDPLYKPDFLVIMSADSQDVFGVIDEIDEKIQIKLRLVIAIIFTFALVGGTVFWFMLRFVSQFLTKPLDWIAETARYIINHDMQDTNSLKLDEDTHILTCRTEIYDLVKEFRTMVRGFSGKGSSTVASFKDHEVQNLISWKESYRSCFKSVLPQDGVVSTRSTFTNSSEEENMVEMPSSAYENNSCLSKVEEDTCNGSKTDESSINLVSKADSTRTADSSNIFFFSPEDDPATAQTMNSTLFRFILCSIVLPYLAVIICICAVCAFEFYVNFPEWVNLGDAVAYELEYRRLQHSTTIKAWQAQTIIPGSLRNLHVLTRIAGWVLFDAVECSQTLTDTEISFVDECKTYSMEETCPFEEDDSRSPCDCKWEDPWMRECRNFSMGSRRHQKAWYMCQKRDADPTTGERKESSSFPEYDNSAKTTQWWTNVTEMPGYSRGTNASGYVTTYDRLRVISAISVAVLPVYNYVHTDRHQTFHKSMSAYVATEADGVFWGYAGCNEDFARYSSFISSEANGASKVNPDLCPLGKYGYDPRCRWWYADTKKKALVDGTWVHVTEPYQYAVTGEVGSSAGSPLIDPRNGEYVGSTLIDIRLTEMFQYLSVEHSAQDTFLIAPDSPEDGDIIFGPNHHLGSEPRSSVEMILPFDAPDSDNGAHFKEVITLMKAGKQGNATFYRTSRAGENEPFKLFYEPIIARILRPVKPDNLTFGSNVSKVLLYSLGVIEKDQVLYAPFQETKDYIDGRLTIVTAVFLVFTAIVTIFCVWISAEISVDITEPMLILLRVVREINAGRINENMPLMAGGSTEVNRVYTSFVKLHKIVRMSISSFFSGDTKRAHKIASDALKTFQKLGDEKAIAIAANNVANSLSVLSAELRDEGLCLDVNGESCVETAIKYFGVAIELGRKEFESSDLDGEKSEFAQQLADRHFNRAMCILLSLDDPYCDEKVKKIALTDLFKCQEFDRSVFEYFLRHKMAAQNSEVYFERLIRRIHGLSLLTPIDDAVKEIWDIDEIIRQADSTLVEALLHGNPKLFEKCDQTSRLQQLEGAIIAASSREEIKHSAALAMRMFVKDKNIIGTSFLLAGNCILRFMREFQEEQVSEEKWTSEACMQTILELRKMQRAGRLPALEFSRSFIFCLEFTSDWPDNALLTQIYDPLLRFYEKCCKSIDSVGFVSHSSSAFSCPSLLPGSKERECDDLRAAFYAATRKVSQESEYPVLPIGIKMATRELSLSSNDVVIVYVSDGSKFFDTSMDDLQQWIRDTKNFSYSSSSVSMIAIGIGDVSETFSEHCKNLCLATGSRMSKYYPSDSNSVQSAFDEAASMVTSCASAVRSKKILLMKLGITMQKF